MGDREPLVRPSASLEQASRGASLASLRPLRLRSAYCSGSCSCASARALPERDVREMSWCSGGRLAGPVGRPGAPPPLGGGGVPGLLVCVPRLYEFTGEAGG